MVQVDKHTVIQILGSLMKKPNLLNDTDKYSLIPEDFKSQLEKYVFSAIYNLYICGAERIHISDIDNYLKDNSYYSTFEKENGIEFLKDCETNSDENNFDYYYNRFKKFNLLQDLQKNGYDIKHIYCEDFMNDDYKKINEKFELLTPHDIINILKSEISIFENKYENRNLLEESTAADGIKELLNDLQQKPEVGCHLQGECFNTIVRGGRKGKFYIRSGSTSIGKSRNMVGDACNIAYPIRFNVEKQQWEETGSCEKVLYVMTEQDPEEIKTMILAYLTGYNEEIFIYGTFGEAEMDRINKAVDIMEKFKDNLLFARIPDPSAGVIKNLFRKYNLQFEVENFFYDYIFSSPAMLNEYRDLGVREDICLRLLSTTLKNLAVELNVFVMSATQVSNEDEKGGFRDYRNIRGSKSIADVADLACIISRPTVEELQLIKKYCSSFSLEPNIITDIYKNRRGRWTMLRIWSYQDLGCCRKADMFVTNTKNEALENFNIIEFINENKGQFKDLVNLYNLGIIEGKVEELYYPADDKNNSYENELANDLIGAFGRQEDIKLRYKDKDFGDFLL